MGYFDFESFETPINIKQTYTVTFCVYVVYIGRTAFAIKLYDCKFNAEYCFIYKINKDFFEMKMKCLSTSEKEFIMSGVFPFVLSYKTHLIKVNLYYT